MKSVGIIGGGITGLTAAFELARSGVPVTLYEGGERVGGPIQTYREDGYLAEHGPNTILETSGSVTQLVRDAGLEAEKLYSDPRAKNRYVVRNGRPVAMPDGLGGFLGTPLFSKRAKFRLFAEPFIGRSDTNFEESIADFVVRRLGSEFLDYAINPLVAGVYAGDPKRLSVRHAFPKLLALEQRYGSLIRGQVLGARERRRKGNVSKQNAPKISFTSGLESLPLALAQRLGRSVKLQHRIDRLQRTEGSWTVKGRNTNGIFASEHSAIIIAIPAHALANISIEGRTDLSTLKEIYYPPVASVVLGFQRDEVQHPLDGFGVLVPEVEPFHILGTVFSSSLFKGRAPSGHVTLTSYVGGSRAPENALVSEEILIERTLADVRKLFGITGKPTFVHYYQFLKAIPQYNVGFGKYRELMARTETQAAGVFIGGHCRCGVSLSDSIESGFQLAEKSREYLRTAFEMTNDQILMTKH